MTAGAVVCHGRITGDIEATSQIVLCAPAVVDGSLTTPVLSMEEGVVFNGTLEMKPQAKVEVLRDTDAPSTSMTSRPLFDWLRKRRLEDSWRDVRHASGVYRVLVWTVMTARCQAPSDWRIRRRSPSIDAPRLFG